MQGGILAARSQAEGESTRGFRPLSTGWQALPFPGLTLRQADHTLASQAHDRATGVSVPDRSATPRSIVRLIRAGTLDAGLASILWMLVEARVPLIVAAPDGGADAAAILGALLECLPPEIRRVDLAGSQETFDWLPQAAQLGWSGTAGAVGAAPVRPDSVMLVAPELSGRAPTHTWGERARIAVRATSLGYGLATTMQAGSLNEVFDALGRPPVSLTADELSYLGCVVILGRPDGDRCRVLAAHYLRPILRDVHGHTQRLGPALLAAWDPADGAYEHFGWGITPELAFRVGQRPGDFEAEVERRRELLDQRAAKSAV